MKGKPVTLRGEVIDLKRLEPLLSLRPSYGLVIIADGSGWCCFSCGRKARTNLVKHKPDCENQIAWPAIQYLQSLLDRAALRDSRKKGRGK